MIARLAAYLLPSLSPRAARAVIIAGAIVAGALALWAAKAIYDHAVIRRHEATQEAARARETARGIIRADEAGDAIRERETARARALEEAERNATQAHPDAARQPVGPAADAVLGELRNRSGR